MYKLSAVFFLLFAMLPRGYAQGPKIEKSEAFEEPRSGWNKVLQLKNGNTIFFHFTKKEGIEVNVFDKSRKMSASKSISSELWDPRKMRTTQIMGLYEIKDEAVLFMVQSDGRIPTLYRLRFNGSTGEMTSEDEIGSLPKINTLSFNTEWNDIVVEKDPQSDCYAVVFFNGVARDPDERIKIIHYNGNHKMINISHYDSPEDAFKFLRFISAVVDADKRVYICVYGAASLKGAESHVYISRLNVGDSTFTNKTLDFTEDFKDTKSVMTYNRTSNVLQLLTLSFATSVSSSTGIYLAFLSCLDPESMALKSVKPVAGTKVNDYVHNVLNSKKDFTGMPQQMIINKDNSTTILSEELTRITISNQQSGSVSLTTVLGAIGVSEINPDGTEKSGYGIMKRQVAVGHMEPFYISSRSKGRWINLLGAADYNSYLSFDYLSTEKNRYLLLNDIPQNFEKEEDELKRNEATDVNKMSTVCYTLNGSKVNKFYLFGVPESKDQRAACQIEASDYQQSTNTYATILVERNGRDREAKMVWVKFE